MRILLAGATGAIGRRVVPLLLAAGHDVTGTTRDPERAIALRAAGVTPMIVDVFDARALRAALIGSRPETVVHQLTDLPRGLPLEGMTKAIERNARIRRGALTEPSLRRLGCFRVGDRSEPGLGEARVTRWWRALADLL